MKKLLFLFLFIFTGLIFAIEPETPPGAGTESSPYQLSKYEHLLWIGKSISNNYVYATLTADIDASSSVLTNTYNYYEEIYDEPSLFYGSFDGQGHTISDLCCVNKKISYSYYYDEWYTNYYQTGFFGYFNGKCQNLNLVGNGDDDVPSCFFAGSFYGEESSAEKINVSNSYFAGYFNGTANTIQVSNGGIFAEDFNGTASDIQASGFRTVIYDYDDYYYEYRRPSRFADDFYGTVKNVKATDSGCFAGYFNGTAETVEVTDCGYFTYSFHGTASDIQVSGFRIYTYDDGDYEYHRSYFAEDFYGTADNVKVIDGGALAEVLSGASVENVEINKGIFAWGVNRSYVNNVVAHDAPCFISWADNSVLERISVDGNIDLNDEFYSGWEDNFGGCICSSSNCIIRNVAVNVNITGGETNTYVEAVGGIIGYDEDGETRIINSFSAGKISSDMSYVGGIVGYFYEDEGTISIENCYFDSSIAPTNGYGTGVSSEELKKQATFENWDFDSVWTIDEGKSYPTLRPGTSQKDMIFCKGLSKAAVSIKGTLSDDDLKAIQDNGNEVCLFSSGSGVEITSRYALEESKSQKFSYKSKDPAVSINYAGKSKSFKFTSASPLITLGKKSGESFSSCALSDTKNKLSSSIKITKDVSEYLKEKAEVSLYHSELSDKVLDGTTMKLSAKGKSLAGKTTENGVKVSVKINLGKKTAQIKYTGMDVVLPVIVKSAE